MRCVIRSHSEERTRAIGEAIGAALRAGDVVALDGELGAGKTRLVGGILKGMGGSEGQVRSPTFTLMQEYECASGPGLVHIDAYRLGGEEDLASLGWEESLTDSAVVIEWSELVGSALPQERLVVRIEHVDVSERIITLDGSADWARRLEGVESAR